MRIWGRDCVSPIGKRASSAIPRSRDGGGTTDAPAGSSGLASRAGRSVKAGDVPSDVPTQREGSGAAGKEQPGEGSGVDSPPRGKAGNREEMPQTSNPISTHPRAPGAAG